MFYILQGLQETVLDRKCVIGCEVRVLGVKNVCWEWSMCISCEECVLGIKFVYLVWSICLGCEVYVLGVKNVCWKWSMCIGCEECLLGWSMFIWCEECLLRMKSVYWMWSYFSLQTDIFSVSPSMSAHNDSLVFVCSRCVQPPWQSTTAIIVVWFSSRTCWSRSNMST